MTAATFDDEVCRGIFADRVSASAGTLGDFVRRRSLIPTRSRRDAESPAEAEIVRLYDRLAELESRPTSPETEDEIRCTLERLRDLQRAEAERMRAHFAAHTTFDPDAAERALAEAVELIRRHGPAS